MTGKLGEVKGRLKEKGERLRLWRDEMKGKFEEVKGKGAGVTRRLGEGKKEGEGTGDGEG